MRVIKGVSEMQRFSGEQRRNGKTIGFVPTMGFLHKGHLSLVRRAVEECDCTVVSVFVNPAQFGPNEDFDAYPRDFERDKALCEEECVNVLFFPSVDEMYHNQLAFVEVAGLGKVLCGKSRPVHFQGVTTVVAKLFNAVKPHKAYFGLKDFQQFVIVKKMAADLNFDLDVVGCPIVREEDGLAMSSRNRYLSKEEREQAVVLNKSLKLAQQMFSQGEKDAGKVREAVLREIAKTNGRVDYVEIVDAESLQPVEEIMEGCLMALAVYFGKHV